MFSTNKSSLVLVTTWAPNNRDFNPNRWVQLGGPTILNYILTGLPGGKIYVNKTFPYIRWERPTTTFRDHTSTYIDRSRLRIPSGFGPDGWIKGLLGQRIIKQ